ncbi:MAG: hypothetical protein JWL58_6586 [Streptosporangiaceae bacterium]|jgi:hypothetical protein|nr:hypothetical protein [Streptosporangiaceae bacterium]
MGAPHPPTGALMNSRDADTDPPAGTPATVNIALPTVSAGPGG